MCHHWTRDEAVEWERVSEELHEEDPEVEEPDPELERDEEPVEVPSADD